MQQKAAGTCLRLFAANGNHSELRSPSKCALLSWLAPPKAGGELALAPERGIVGRKAAPLRRFATPVHLAVPEKPVGLALILGIFDRCGNSGFASSATGSAKPESPVAGRGKCVRPQFSVRGEGFGLSYSPVTVEPLQSRRQAAVTAPPAGEPGAAPTACRAPTRDI